MEGHIPLMFLIHGHSVQYSIQGGSRGSTERFEACGTWSEVVVFEMRSYDGSASVSLDVSERLLYNIVRLPVCSNLA